MMEVNAGNNKKLGRQSKRLTYYQQEFHKEKKEPMEGENRGKSHLFEKGSEI